ncbi:hypothetical protein KGM_211723 [Danaus plexippus plexippus]|uniref:Uncharacterized protein n=1 Tax=Danaus plexippus plexippus TaxID=278856 RepID=A0A212EPG6_DANPL|nr:hypothetical protein KGM_211723 [Danaus plexippus plexippus]
MEILYVIVMTVLMGNEAYEQKSTTPRSTQVNQCGLDKSPIKVVYEGEAKIETYPWLGTLFYTSREKKYSTSVILVAQQIVIGSAMDIDRLPKNDFRSRARVVLGHNCTRPGIRIKDYSYHPHFNKASYSSLALIQLETNFRSNGMGHYKRKRKAEETLHEYAYKMLQIVPDDAVNKVMLYGVKDLRHL